MTSAEPTSSRVIGEVVLVVREIPASNPGSTVRQAWSAGVSALTGLVDMGAQVGSATAQAAVAIGQSAVSATWNSVLDRVIPAAVSAVVSRVDRVDLAPAIDAVLDSIDLTAVVRDRVDIDAIADRVDLDRILDRIPLIDVANYIIDEIDLARIIRESTGGIAVDSVNGLRFQALHADARLAAVVDALLLRRRARTTAVRAGMPPTDDGERT